MKYTRLSLPAILFLFFSGDLNAQPRQKLDINEAVVFLSGAELTSTAKLTLVKGENEIMFTNVAADVNSRNISVNASNGIVVEAATFQNNYLGTDIMTPRAREIKDSIEIITEAKKLTDDKIAAIWEQVEILKANRKVGGNNTGLSVAELTKMLDLAGSKMESCLDQKTKLDGQQKKTDERLTKLNNQLDEEQKKGMQPGGQLLVKFYAKEATITDVTIDYIVPNAGWSPTYDISADNVNSPIKLFYKANIRQGTGVNWNNVHLTLSTGNPNEGVQAPDLSPWFLAFYIPQPMYNKSKKVLSGSEIATMPTTEVADLVSTTPGVYQSQRGQEQSSINEYVAVDNAGINTSFDIDLPYTIPCDGKQHLVAIKKYELPATYRYYAVPKQDKDAFLQAQVTNWEDLNLLPGQTNIFYEGTYVGLGMIDVRNVKDTMNISLGRDKKIVVKRERDTKLRSVKTIGTNVRETFAYSITIRNTRKENINLIVEDQMPVSNDKDIVLEDTDAGGAEVDATTGMMKWAVSLNPDETRKLEFGFTVKYPKGKVITNLR